MLIISLNVLYQKFYTTEFMIIVKSLEYIYIISTYSKTVKFHRKNYDT